MKLLTSNKHRKKNKRGHFSKYIVATYYNYNEIMKQTKLRVLCANKTHRQWHTTRFK